MKFNLLALFFLVMPFLANAQQVKNEKVSELLIYYAHDSYRIDNEYLSKIDSILSLYDKNIVKIFLSSGTDSDGELAYNQKLSEFRSDAVTKCLIAKGLKKDCFQTQSFGEIKPIADNSNKEGRMKNRYSKVEFFIERIILENRISMNVSLLDENNKAVIADSQVLVFYGNESDTFITDKNGFLSFSVPDSVKVIDFFVKDHFFSSVSVNKDSCKDVKVDIPFKKAKIGNMAIFDNIIFYGDKAIMLNTSFSTCDNIARFLIYNTHLKVEIAGHVNVPNQERVSRYSDEYNLSERRAETVCNYLAEKGISRDRFISKGYGNWEMIYPNAVSEEDQQKNRRVEVRIIK